MTPLEHVQDYFSAGMAPIPVAYREKGPTYKGWQKLRLTADELPSRFIGKVNVGVLNGEPSGWRVDVDLDHPVVVRLAPKFLPPTGSKFGRASKLLSHWGYIAVGAKTKQFKIDKTADTDAGRMLCELRSTGTQTIMPGSTHTEGEAIEWGDNGEPAVVDADELLAAIQKLAEAAAAEIGVKLSSTVTRSQEVKQATGKAAERAREFILAEPPAISGKGGHAQTFYVACELYRFGITDAEASSLLNEYNQRCQPEWQPHELDHKLADAREVVVASGEFGIYVAAEVESPTLDTIARGLKLPSDGKSGYIFPNFAVTNSAIVQLGGNLPTPPVSDRQVVLMMKGSWLNAQMPKLSGDPKSIDGWVLRTGNWNRGVMEIRSPVRQAAPVVEWVEPDTSELVRHVLSPGGSNIGWCIKINGRWVNQNKDNCKSVLMKEYDVEAIDATKMLGTSIINAYDLVDHPFQPEYPSETERIWNRFGAQLAFKPEPGPHPHFDMVLNHIGQSLDVGVAQNPWCRKRGCRNGATYLTWWFASVFQNPLQLLPWLFFYGDQNFGKSSLHEMCGMMMTKGYVMVNKAFTRKNGFNAELAGAILAVVEETDLASNLEHAYTLIKELTTNPHISIELKGWDAYQQRNIAHFIQAGQFALHCPITDPKDSRVVVGAVAELPTENRISAPLLRQYWQREAPAFLNYLLHEVRLPEPSEEDDRLYLPVLDTTAKWTVINGVAKLKSLQPYARPAAVIAQQIAVPVRQLASDNWIIQKSCTDLLVKLKAMGIEDLPENPEQIGQALNFISFGRSKKVETRTNSNRLISVVPLTPDDEKYWDFDDGVVYTDDEIVEEECRLANLF